MKPGKNYSHYVSIMSKAQEVGIAVIRNDVPSHEPNMNQRLQVKIIIKWWISLLLCIYFKITIIKNT